MKPSEAFGKAPWLRHRRENAEPEDGPDKTVESSSKASRVKFTNFTGYRAARTIGASAAEKAPLTNPPCTSAVLNTSTLQSMGGGTGRRVELFRLKQV